MSYPARAEGLVNMVTFLESSHENGQACLNLGIGEDLNIDHVLVPIGTGRKKKNYDNETGD